MAEVDQRVAAETETANCPATDPPLSSVCQGSEAKARRSEQLPLFSPSLAVRAGLSSPLPSQPYLRCIICKWTFALGKGLCRLIGT